MPPLPKAIEKDKSIVKEAFVMDVEAEVDRRLLCEKILTQIDLASAKQALLSQTTLNFQGAAVAANNQSMAVGEA